MGRTCTDVPDEFEPSKFDCICSAIISFFLFSLQSVVHNGNVPIPPFDIRPAVLEIAKDDTVVMDMVFQPPQVKSFSVDMGMVCDNCNVKHFSIKGKYYWEP